MIIYNQLDTKWSKQVLGFNPIGAGYTIGSHGCLITSICSILSAHGIHITPPEINNRLKEVRGYEAGTGNYWWGSISRIFSEVTEVSSWSGDLQIIIDAINEGKGVMVEVDGNLNTTTWDMHFAAVHSVKNGIIYLADPWGGVVRPLTFYKNVVKRITLYTVKKKYSMTDDQTNEFIKIIQGNPNIGTAAQREHLVNALNNKDYEYWNIYSPSWFNEMAQKASQPQLDVGTITNDPTRTVTEPAEASVEAVKPAIAEPIISNETNYSINGDGRLDSSTKPFWKSKKFWATASGVATTICAAYFPELQEILPELLLTLGGYLVVQGTIDFKATK